MKDKGIKYSFTVSGRAEIKKIEKLRKGLLKFAEKMGLEAGKEKIIMKLDASLEKSRIKLSGSASDPSVKSIIDTL